MAIKGSLKEASLPDVLQLLALGQKTGCLSMTDRSNMGYIYFDRGRITYASIVNRRDRLGDILLSSGRISREQLDEAVSRQGKDRDRKLGQILVETNALTTEELEKYMRVQVEEAVFFLFTWTQGSFQFEVDVRPEREAFTMSINPESLLLEGARRIDEWSLIEKKVPSFDIVFRIDAERIRSSEADLTEVQRTVIPLLDNRRDVAAVVEASGLSEFDVGKAIYGLVTAGFAHKARTSEAVRPTQATDARIEEHRNLGVAFYKTGMFDEAGREFRRVVELDSEHARAHFQLGLVAIHQDRWEDAVLAFEKVLEVDPGRMSAQFNLAFSKEQLGHFDESEALYGDATSGARRNPKVLTGWGASALRHGKYEVAQGRLDRAREVLDDGGSLSEIWYWARSLVAALRGHVPEALSVIHEGLGRYPSSAVLRNNLAVLLEAQGDLEEAEDILRSALGEGLTLPQMSKNLGDLLYRHGRYDDAWDSYERAVAHAPLLGDDVYFKLGNIAYRRMDHERAKQMWGKALEINPDHQLARTNLETMNALRG